MHVREAVVTMALELAYSRHEFCHDKQALLSMCGVGFIADAKVRDDPLVSQCTQHAVLQFKTLDRLSW